MKLHIVLLLTGVLGVTEAGLKSAQSKSDSNQTRLCLSCHDQDGRHAESQNAAHGALDCSDCHQHVLSAKYHPINGQSKPPELDLEALQAAKLSESKMLSVHQQCRQCHRAVFDQWKQSGHSMTYGRVFLDRHHNRQEPPMNDCLRCHGMFWEFTIGALVSPLDMTGPWHLTKPELEQTPAIPCLACHQIHRLADAIPPGSSKSPYQRQDKVSTSPASFGFYDRREKRFFNAADLPHPKVRAGDTAVAVSTDVRMRNCYQCHTPDATHVAGTSDDRTPRGVHAGLSCAECHNDHSLEAGESCSRCHPRQSHCSLDVRSMDTTARSAASPHDVHTVGCGDCHQGQRPSSASN